MIKKVFLSIIIFFLIMPGVYFYARGFSEAGSAFGFTKEDVDAYKKKSELDSNREEEMEFIFKNIARLLPPEISSDGIQFVNRFWFVKDSYKEVYVEYGYQDVKGSQTSKRKILVHVIRDEKNLFKYFLFNYFEFGKGKGWNLRQVREEQLALDLKKFGLYEKEPLEILTYILKREKKKGKLYTILHSNLMLYLVMGNDISTEKDLDLYEVVCKDDTFDWIKKEP